MTSPRPNFIDVRSQSQASASSRSMRSPRLHVAGEAPPELSPLDAFALQSRLLAKQLQESAYAGKRMSRLPPLTTASPLIVQGRSDYFRSMSHDSATTDNADSPDATPQPEPTGLGLRTEIEESPLRPMSMHPRLGRIPPPLDDPDHAMPPAVTPYDFARGRQLHDIEENASYFGARKEDRSPSPIGSFASLDRHHQDYYLLNPAANPASAAAAAAAARPLPGNSTTRSDSSDSYAAAAAAALVPPRPPFASATRSSSAMSSSLESADEDGHSSATSLHSQPPRKLSTGSAVVSPHLGSFRRSPSVASDASAHPPRPSFNFSRPMSRAETPALDIPARQASSDSQASFILADDTANTPVSMNGDGFPDPLVHDAPEAAPSYIYSKFSLPRGKMLQRASAELVEAPPQLSLFWEPPPFAPPSSNLHTLPPLGRAPPSPPTRPTSSAGLPPPRPLSPHPPLPSLERTRFDGSDALLTLGPAAQPSPDPSRPSTDGGRSSGDVPRGRQPLPAAWPRPQKQKQQQRDLGAKPERQPPPPPLSLSTSLSPSPAAAAAAAMDPQYPSPVTSAAADMPAHEHVDLAIGLHEKGSLSESTYHLRHAARQGDPTGMLLYALACRHGWGMRANPREGAAWLRRAADCASLAVADDEALLKEGRAPADTAGTRRARKAQFALSIYELGVSYMNGWGIGQDKALALRCFEIAGAWGDVDALAEAGFCYAQGIGGKKNLKTSAKFYRMAEDKGMSMMGNSWIHKSKYNDEGKESPKSIKEKKSRSKSRTRNLFGIKHSS